MEPQSRVRSTSRRRRRRRRRRRQCIQLLNASNARLRVPDASRLYYKPPSHLSAPRDTCPRRCPTMNPRYWCSTYALSGDHFGCSRR
ncbi:hypothetical protein BV25DRAFT_496699 [Artomyces pyxidatus]|uniref:Uncharacterized protein n=1 Tax=Artomyces pyxidatus TaxID=48021 RepID=A0ACB8T3R0_9AGAM|nr:hypothetical protein BV25DRAFT_496699 [Artomyces pyxidatus]